MASVLILLLLMLLPLIGGVLLVVMSRKRGKGFPTCGQCGYDVSGTLGTTMARCPECGSDFGMVGITPAVTKRNVPALIAGLALILVPITCIGGSVLMTRASFTRAQSARQAAIAAQQQALTAAQQTQLLSGPVDPALVSTFRTQAAAMTFDQAAQRVSEISQDLAQRVQDQSLDESTAANLRAEMAALNERLGGGPNADSRPTQP